MNADDIRHRFAELRAKVDRERLYPVADALKVIKENATAKFNESIDVSINLGIDAKKSDQNVRGAVVLPRGTGKDKRVAVFAQGDNAVKAKEAGALDCLGEFALLLGRNRGDSGRDDLAAL